MCFLCAFTLSKRLNSDVYADFENPKFGVILMRKTAKENNVFSGVRSPEKSERNPSKFDGGNYEDSAD